MNLTVLLETNLAKKTLIGSNFERMLLKSSGLIAHWNKQGQAIYPSKWNDQLQRMVRKLYWPMSRRSQWWAHSQQKGSRRLPSRSTRCRKPQLPEWTIRCPSPNKWLNTNLPCRKHVAHKLQSRRGSNRCIAICLSGAYTTKDRTSSTKWLFNHLFKVLHRRTNSWEIVYERTWELDNSM